jgi:hypothetical protein
MSDEPNKSLPPPKLGWDAFKRSWANLKTNFGFANSGKLIASLKSPTQFLLVIAGLCFALFLVYWIFDKVFIYFVARSYVQEIAEAFDLNKYLANAIVYLTFVALAFFGAMIFRFSKQKRLIGVFGIIGLLIAHSLIMWLATSNIVISRKGEALKCYVITRDTVRYGVRPGIDPETGRQCRPVTAEIIGRLREYEKGNRPKQIANNNPTFFDPGTGEPIVWYYKNENGNIAIFDLMGFHPDTGVELLPVTREVVDAWKDQEQLAARQAPQRINPETYAFFDPITGKPRVWYRRSENGDFEFYDRPGFHPLTGEPLTVVTRDLIDTWRRYQADLASQKCYIITQNSVKYSNHLGIDPDTGRQCRPLTSEMLERLREYEKGKRPKKIESANPTFFDLRTGEPIVWYYKDKDSNIELFDLMGFHPDSGDELLPVTKEIVDLWKNRKKIDSVQAPRRIDPEKYAFFDPVTGKPRVWYWRSENGEYEFYDNLGFQPRTGEKLLIITSDAIRAWKADQDLNTKKRLNNQRLLDEDERKRKEELAKSNNADAMCDQLAANPRDSRKAPGVPGVAYDALRYQANEAIDVCSRAVQKYPNELRFQYQLARALEFNNPDKALELQLKLGRLQYPASYDNAAGIFLRKKMYPDALRQFQLGVQHGDPDAMVSLAEMIKKGRAEGDYMALYVRAASLGHEGAQLAVQQEQQHQADALQQRAIEAEQQKRAMEMFGTILRSVPMR